MIWSQVTLNCNESNSHRNTWTTEARERTRGMEQWESKRTLKAARSKQIRHFNFLLRSLVRCWYITVAALPTLPEEENTREVKLPLFNLVYLLLIGMAFLILIPVEGCRQGGVLVTLCKWVKDLNINKEAMVTRTPKSLLPLHQLWQHPQALQMYAVKVSSDRGWRCSSVWALW